MSYNEHLADRIRLHFKAQNTFFTEKKMMGGLCFMVDDKMCCGIHFDKKKNVDLIMARIGDEASPEAMLKEGCYPMDFTGRPMKGYVFIDPLGFDMEDDLSYWISLCIAFNPFAKISKKKQKKMD